GRPCIVAVARDLSRRREAEARYRDLLEVIDKGILIQDAEGALVHANTAALRMVGAPGGEPSPHGGGLFERWMLLHADGSEMPVSDFPAMRALRGGHQVASTLVGLYHRTRRTLLWLSVTSIP